MGKILGIILICLVTHCSPLPAQAGTSQDVVNQIFVSAPDGDHWYKIATLPISSAATYDHLHLLATINFNDAAPSNYSIDAVFGNRNQFVYSYFGRGGNAYTLARIVGYMNTDTSVDLYLNLGNAYTSGSYTILQAEDEMVYPTPQFSSSPPATGTIVFDTSQPQTFPPTSFTKFDLTGTGAFMGIGTMTPHSTLEVNGNLTLSSGTNASIVFPDGGIQAHAWTGGVIVSADGITTFKNSDGTAGIQFATNSQSIGGFFGEGGGLILQGNSLTDKTYTGGYLYLGGNRRGDTTVGQSYLYGNSVIDAHTPDTPAGILVDGNDHGSGIQNNVGIGLVPGAVPAAKLEVSGSIKLTGGALTFADGSTQNTAGIPITGSSLQVQGSTSGVIISGANLDPVDQYPLANLANTQKLLFGWNLTAGGGEQDIVSNRGAGANGGFQFLDINNSGVLTSLLTLLGNGSVGIGTTTPSAPLEVDGRILLGGSSGSIKFANGPELTSAVVQQLINSSASPTTPYPTITQLGTNVGIGVSNPAATLDVNGYLRVDGSTTPNTTSQGAYLGWNALNGGYGETDIINNQGGGSGGFAFMKAPSDSAVARTTLMFLDGAGNLGLGTTAPGAKLEVDGSIKIAGSGASISFPDTTVQATAWNGILAGGDYAEAVDVSGSRTLYEAGDVLLIDVAHPGRFAKANSGYSRLVAGVYSTKPGLVVRRTAAGRSNKEEEVPMAMMGIVPTKVSAENGPIEPGDLLVSAATSGYAMKGTDSSRMLGSVIGKALEPLSGGSGLIEVLVTLQ